MVAAPPRLDSSWDYQDAQGRALQAAKLVRRRWANASMLGTWSLATSSRGSPLLSIRCAICPDACRQVSRTRRQRASSQGRQTATLAHSAGNSVTFALTLLRTLRLCAPPPPRASMLSVKTLSTSEIKWAKVSQRSTKSSQNINQEFAKVDRGFTEIRGKFDATAAGQQQIVDLLQTFIKNPGSEADG